MKSVIVLITFYALALFLTGCAVEPRPINYGKDACAFCEMTIVDRQHASEIVTKTGKAYKYDSIECMLRDRKNHTDETIALYLVCDFAQAGQFTDALQAVYLVSENIPSPMVLISLPSERNRKRKKCLIRKGDACLPGRK